MSPSFKSNITCALSSLNQFCAVVVILWVVFQSKGLAQQNDVNSNEQFSSGTALNSSQYIYDPTGKRDPFRPFRGIRIAKPSDGDRTKDDKSILEPLQTFNLEQLKILGILWDVRQPRALVQDSEGRVHTLVKNTKIGKNNGYVAAIREGEIVIIEAFEEGDRIVKRTQIMELSK